MESVDYLSYFPEVLVVATIITGIIWSFEKLWFAPQRKKKALNGQVVKRSVFLSYSADIFVILFVIGTFRFFIIEPYKIPSSSMRPVLIPGDFIVVNRFAYGLRVPLSNQRFLGAGAPKRGDVVVFQFPLNRRITYIKRIIGLPNDVIVYQGKKLIINGVPQNYKALPNYFFKEEYNDKEYTINAQQWQEVLNSEPLPISHNLLTINQAVRNPTPPEPEFCQSITNGFTCTIPAGKYFVMGDNRDNSEDSRYWGFLDDGLLLGKAMFIGMNFSHISRVGSIQ